MSHELFAFLGGLHPFLQWCTLWTIWGGVWLVMLFLQYTLKIISRVLRVFLVAIRGWPPAHLDADGDWKPEPEVES